MNALTGALTAACSPNAPLVGSSTCDAHARPDQDLCQPACGAHAPTRITREAVWLCIWDCYALKISMR